MKIKTIYAEAKKSKNYQTYSVSLSADLEDGEEPVQKVRELQTMCRKLANEQINIDNA